MPAPLPHRTDEQLFARFRACGDVAALGELFDRTAPALLRVALHLTRDPATAEDLLQDTFLRAIEARGDWDAARPLLPWLCGVLHNRARRERWDRGRQPDAARVAAAALPDPAQVAAHAEFDAAIDAAIAGLPEPYRPVLRLHLAYGQPAAAIAHALDRPAATVRSQLARGLEQLRRLLPAGFAGGAALALLGERGLAAVKQTVVASALATAPAAAIAATTLGGMLTMKKLVSGAIAMGIAAVVWWSWPQPDAPALAGAGAAAAVAAEQAVLPRAAATSGEDGAAPSAREGVVPAPIDATGALRIRCRFAADDAAAFGVLVQLAPRVRDGAFLTRTATTGDDGTVVVHDLPAGRVGIAAERGGTAETKVVAGTTTDVTLTIPVGVLVRGRVVDETGAPVATARVWLSEHARNYCDGAFVCGVNADGRFELRDVQPERFLSATAPGRRSAAVLPVRATWGSNCDVELVLRGPGAALHGTVVDADGAPAVGARVLVGYRTSSMGWTPLVHGSHRPPPACVADAKGTFTAHGLPVGQPQKVWVRNAGHCVWVETVTMPETGDATVMVRLQRGASLAGRAVLADGRPAAGAWIDHVSSAWSDGEPPAVDNGTPDWIRTGASTDAEGRYRIDCITPGRLRLLAGLDRAFVRGEVLAVGDENATWDPVFAAPEAASLRGRVVDERGAPRRGIDVRAQAPRGFGHPDTVATDGDGRFVCTNLAAVPHVVRFVWRGIEVAARFGVEPGPDELLVTIADAAISSAVLTGRVVGSDGRSLVSASPLEAGLGAKVRASRADHHDEPTVDVAADGTFRFGPLPAATWRLQVEFGDGPVRRRSGWSEPIALLHGEARDVGTLRMPATGTIVVTATDADGKPRSGIVTVESSTGWSETSWMGGMLDRELRIDGIAPGPHRVKVVASGLPAHYHPVTVVADQEVRADLRIPKGIAVKLVLPPIGDPVPVHLHFTWRRDGELLHRYTNWWEANGERTWTEHLAPGHYEVTVVSETGKRAQSAFTVGPEDPPDRTIVIAMP